MMKAGKEISRVCDCDSERIFLEVEKNVSSLQNRLIALIHQAPIMIFIKGTPDAPRCGFTSQLIRILNSLGLKYNHFDILSDEEIRQGLKVFSNWPTYPQIYINGDFIGGLDIFKELIGTNQLNDILPAQ